MTSDFDEIKIENFGNEDRVKKFSFAKFTKIFKFEKKKLNEKFETKERNSIKKLFAKKKEKKNYVDFPSGYGEFAKLVFIDFSVNVSIAF
jgi:hypothetical protein